MTSKHSTGGAAPTVADLTSQIADTRDRLADTVEQLAAKADVGARVRDAADQAKERVSRTADQARERFGRTTDHAKERVGHTADQAKERVGRTTDHAKERVSHTADHARHAVEDRVGSAAHSVRAGGSRVKEHAAGFADTAGAAVGEHSESSAREMALEVARYGGPVLAAAGGIMLGTAVVLALTRRRH
ncbi:hypothetical protein KNE206_45050 [Kitasatospora sp. NE20-6]|uniref:DUF3618 domain-containing protein n=1 Tax=Kitasatospora sp. NE20-6 TaxID=2859066 RepID=UPI0034DBFE08